MSYSDTRTKINEALGFFWLRVFTDTDFIKGWTQSLAVPFWNLDRMAAELPEYQGRYDIPIKDVKDTHLFVFSEADVDRDAHKYGDGLLYGEGSIYGEQVVTLTEWNYPIAEDLSPAYLTGSVFGGHPVWQRGVDYDVINGRIIFREDPLNLPGVEKLPTSADGETVIQFLLWGFKTDRDVQAVQDMFGVIGGVYQFDSSEDYKEAVNIAWDLRTDGASLQNIHRLLSHISDVDYVSAIGTVMQIFDEGDRVVVMTEDQVYTAPLGTGVLVELGDQLAPGTPIFNSYSLRSGKEEVDFEDFEGLLLEQGVLGSGYINGIFLPNEQVPVQLVHADSWTSLRFDEG